MGRKKPVMELAEIEDVEVRFKAPKNMVDFLREEFENRGTTIQAYFRLHTIAVFNRRPKVHDVHTPIAFGKYRGVPLEEIIRCDPDYIRWCLGAIENFAITDDAYRLLEFVTNEAEVFRRAHGAY